MKTQRRTARLLAVSTLAATMTASLAACSGGPSTSTSNTGSEQVTLTYGVWSQEETMQKVADAFEKANPDIKINLQVNPWTEFWTKLQVGAQGGTAPDAFWMLADHFQIYADGGQLLPLDDAIKDANIDMSVYPEALVNLFNYSGKQFGLPKDFDTVGLWYNKAMFDKAGIAYPTTDWTWDDVKSASAKLTDQTAGVYGIAAPLNRQEGFYNTIPQAGGEVITKDGKSGYSDPKTQAGLQYWVDFIKDGNSPTLQQMADTEAVAMFENEQVAMYYGGSFYAKRFYDNEALRAKVDVTELPAGAKKATVINGIQNVGYAQSAHPNELKKFLIYLGSEEAAKIQAATGAVIPAYTGTQKAWVDSMPDFNLQSFMDSTAFSVPYPVSKNTAVWNEYEMTELTKAWQLEESVADAANALSTQMDKALTEEKR